MRVLIPDGAEINRHRDGDAITKVLEESKTIAVVGLSSNPMRPSHGVTEYMQSAGYRIIPVNPNETEVLGEKSYARLEDVSEKIDIVNVFRRAEEVPPVVESAIRISVGTAEENDKCLSAMAQVILKRAGKGELAAR